MFKLWEIAKRAIEALGGKSCAIQETLDVLVASQKKNINMSKTEKQRLTLMPLNFVQATQSPMIAVMMVRYSWFFFAHGRFHLAPKFVMQNCLTDSHVDYIVVQQ